MRIERKLVEKMTDEFGTAPGTALRLASDEGDPHSGHAA